MGLGVQHAVQPEEDMAPNLVPLANHDCRGHVVNEGVLEAHCMGQLTVREVDDATIAALKLRAAANGRSMEAEHRQLLREVLDTDRRAIEDFKEAAARLRARIAKPASRSKSAEDIVRAMRDSR
jgi:plasmid stability protein